MYNDVLYCTLQSFVIQLKLPLYVFSDTKQLFVNPLTSDIWLCQKSHFYCPISDEFLNSLVNEQHSGITKK